MGRDIIGTIVDELEWNESDFGTEFDGLEAELTALGKYDVRAEFDVDDESDFAFSLEEDEGDDWN